MSVQEDEESVQENENVRKEKNARFELRINSEFKEKLREEAKENNSSLSEYILGFVRTRNNRLSVQKQDKCTDNNMKIYKTCCKQLISLFDKIFKLKFSLKTIDKMTPILDQEIDEKLIEEVRKNLELER